MRRRQLPRGEKKRSEEGADEECCALIFEISSRKLSCSGK